MTATTHVNPFLYLQRNAERDPRGVFTHSVEQTVTNDEAHVLAKQFAYEFRRMGMAAGEIVALDLPDQLRAIAIEAVYHEGAIPTVLPAGYIAEGFSIGWVITRGTPATQPGARVIDVDARFLQQVQENPYGIQPREYANDALWIAFSSGTTGTPNAIPLTHRALAGFEDALDTWFQGDPFLVLMDMGTAWGLGGFFLSVKGGKPFLVAGGADQAGLVRLASERAVTSLKGSPAQFAALVDELERQQRTLPHVQTVFFGGTVMPPGIAERLRAATEGCEIYGMYGSTEATIATVKRYESENPTDAGQLVDGSELEIVDDDDRVLPAGVPGRIRHRNPAMVHGYLGDPDATARAFRNGWFYSGDLGLLRPDGGLTLTGRETEVLNAGGVKIDPVKLDLFAAGLPGIREACAFERTATSGLREVGIALVADDGFDVQATADALKAEFGAAAPVFIARVDEIPRNAMGKPMRRSLAGRLESR